jgi:flagellar hook-length control protein FliK
MPPRAGAALSATQASQQAASTAPSDARTPSHLAAAMTEPVMQLALAATGLSPRRAERADERGPSVFSPVHADNQTGAPAAGASPLMPAVDPASAGAGTGHAGLNERMVDQVSWWLSQRTQGAELQLDVAGGAPVSVSVQVQGNEAQVAFRSDHPEARQLLANALPQLEKMMGAEGLVLSGASVGSSGGSGQQGEAPPGAPARAGQGEKDALAAPAAPVRRPVSGRALDLYV